MLATEKEKEKFIADFSFICKNNPEITLTDQSKKWEEYRWFHDLPIRQKIELLDSFSTEQKSRLKSVWFKFQLWIDSPSILTSVDIRSEAIDTRDTPFFKEPIQEIPVEKPKPKPEPVAAEPTRTQPKRTAKTPSRAPVKSKRAPRKKKEDEKPVEVETKKEEKKVKRALRYSCTFGRFVKLQDYMVKSRKMSEPYRVFQLWRFEFEQTNDGRTHCKSWVDGPADPHKRWPSESSPDTESLGFRGVVHETADEVCKFLAEHVDNLADEVYVDVQLWSRHFRLPKFRHVKKLTIRHHTPATTQLWLTHVYTMKSIPEVTLLRNYDGSDPTEAAFREIHPFKNHEAMPYVIPFEGRQMPHWVHVTPYCENAIFWAKKLTIEPVAEMRLTDISKLYSVAELNVNFRSLDGSELNKFLKMWSVGEMGHRLVRLSVKLDYSLCFANRGILDNLEFVEITEDSKVSDELKSSVLLESATTYVIYRNWPKPGSLLPQMIGRTYSMESATSDSSGHTPASLGGSTPPLEEQDVANGNRADKPERRNSRGRSMADELRRAASEARLRRKAVFEQERTISTSSDNITTTNSSESDAGSVRPTPPPISSNSETTQVKESSPSWVGGACAILQLRNDDEIIFTAVRNEKMASELLENRPKLLD